MPTVTDRYKLIRAEEFDTCGGFIARVVETLPVSAFDNRLFTTFSAEALAGTLYGKTAQEANERAELFLRALRGQK